MVTKNMQVISQKTLFIIFVAFVLALGGVSIAFAEESSGENGTDATSDKPRPLQILHDARLEIKERTREGLQRLKVRSDDIRTETRIEIKNATSGLERREIIDEVRDRQGELRDERKQLHDSLKERLQALYRTHLGSAIARFNRAIQHFDNFVARIESRMEKLEGRDVDTTSVDPFLDTAKAAIATAETDVQALSSLVASVTDDSDINTVKTDIRAAVSEAIASVKAAHRALVEVVKQLAALAHDNSDDPDASGDSDDSDDDSDDSEEINSDDVDGSED